MILIVKEHYSLVELGALRVLEINYVIMSEFVIKRSLEFSEQFSLDFRIER